MGNRLYVGNLSFGTDETALRTAFGAHGQVMDVKIITDRDTGQSRGFAFVEMADVGSTKNAMTKLNGAVIDGRPLRVSEAEERPTRGGGGGGGGGGGQGKRYR